MLAVKRARRRRHSVRVMKVLLALAAVNLAMMVPSRLVFLTLEPCGLRLQRKTAPSGSAFPGIVPNYGSFDGVRKTGTTFRANAAIAREPYA